MDGRGRTKKITLTGLLFLLRPVSCTGRRMVEVDRSGACSESTSLRVGSSQASWSDSLQNGREPQCSARSTPNVGRLDGDMLIRCSAAPVTDTSSLEPPLTEPLRTVGCPNGRLAEEDATEAGRLRSTTNETIRSPPQSPVTTTPKKKKRSIFFWWGLW